MSLPLVCVHCACFTAQYHSEAAGGCGMHSRVPAFQQCTSSSVAKAFAASAEEHGPVGRCSPLLVIIPEWSPPAWLSMEVEVMLLLATSSHDSCCWVLSFHLRRTVGHAHLALSPNILPLVKLMHCDGGLHRRQRA